MAKFIDKLDKEIKYTLNFVRVPAFTQQLQQGRSLPIFAVIAAFPVT